MVLALREEFDVFHDHHLVVVNIEECIVQHLGHVHGVAAREEGHGLLHALRGAHQAIAGRVFSNADEQLTVQVLRGNAIQQGCFDGGGGTCHS